MTGEALFPITRLPMWIGCMLKRLPTWWTSPASLLLWDRASYSCASNFNVGTSFCLCWANQLWLHPPISWFIEHVSSYRNHYLSLGLSPSHFTIAPARILLALGPSIVKQRGVKRSPENAWKNTCSFLSVIYSVHKVSDSPFKRCKSPRKAVLNDLHLIFMIHMAFHPKCQKWKKKKKTSYPYGSIRRQNNNLICNQTAFQIYRMTRIWYIQGWKPVFLFALKSETFT